MNALRPTGSSALTIDGKLVPGSAGVFETINPATEQVLGHAANANADDMDAAIAAARAAFDNTDWSRDHAFRARCIRQLRDGLLAHIEELREITIAEVGAPRALTTGPQLEGPVNDLGYFADLAESYVWETDLGHAEPMGIPTRRTIRRSRGTVRSIMPNAAPTGRISIGNAGKNAMFRGRWKVWSQL